MCIKIIDVINLLNDLANESLALDWDNVGLIIGDTDSTVKNVLVALDINDKVYKEAVELGANLIITHHPYIFEPIKKINSGTMQGRVLLGLIRNNISVYTMHTNLDIAGGGTNDVLCGMLKLNNVQGLYEVSDGNYLGRVGDLDSYRHILNFTEDIRYILNLRHVNCVIGNITHVKKVALCTGSGSNTKLFNRAKELKADVYITGDIKFHDAQKALALGLSLIDITHYSSEVIVTRTLTNYLLDNLDNIVVRSSSENSNPFTLV